MGKSGRVQPIRDWQKIEAMYKYFLSKGQYRNWLMFKLGLNMALRISDFLHLKISDMYNEDMQPMAWITVREQKTGKLNKVGLSQSAQDALRQYADMSDTKYSHNYLFKSRQGEGSITRVQAYRILTAAAGAVGITEDIGTHTLRKTWGYHAYTRFNMRLDDIMLKLNHYSISATKHYIGLTDDEKMDIENTVSF